MPKLFLLTCILQLSFIKSYSQIDQRIENLKTFAKVYGYVKYFHPSDEAADIDWDKFAVYGVKEIENCPTREELQKKLYELFLPVAPSIQFYSNEEKINYDLSRITPSQSKKYKTTYWQHNGVSLGMMYQGSTYKSSRIGRENKIKINYPNAYGFGNVATSLNIEKYQSKKIKFSGYVRMSDGLEGTGHLWFRVDKTDGSTGLFQNMDDNPITKNEWTNYEIAGLIDSNARTLSLGAFLKGEGEMLLDDVHLYYQENDQWIEIPIKNNDFELEEIGNSKNPKTWNYACEDFEIKTITQTMYQGKKSVSIKNKPTFKTETGKKLFDKTPLPGEYINKDIGNGLHCIIPLVLYYDKSGTYPKATNNSIKNELKKIKFEEYNLALSLGDIIITWNIFQHFYPYFDVTDVNWNDELVVALVDCFDHKTHNDLAITLQELTAKLKDGHISVNGGDLRHYTPSISWEFIENQLVITKVCDDNLNLKPGDVVTKIESKDSKKYFEEIEKRISAATSGWLNYRANKMTLSGGKNSEISIEVNGKIIALKRDTQIRSEGLNCTDTTTASHSFKILDNDVVYVNIDLIEMKTLDSLLPQLQKSKAIICDLRGYPNGNDKFISYLLNENDDDKWMFVPKIIYPDRENSAGYSDYGWNVKAKKPHLDAKIIFITDGSAISYAESYMGFIKAYNLATIVGQPTAGTNGNVNPFQLPGGYSIWWTGMKVLKHDGSQHHGIGIIPDVYVNKTIQGVKEGRDEFLEKAIEIANKE